MSDKIKCILHLKNNYNSLWIQPLFIIILVNSWLKFEFDNFDIFFDTNSCVFNHRAKSSP